MFSLSGAARLHIGALAVSLALVAATPSAAAVIAEDTSGATSSRFQFFWGQSFTTPAGNDWTNVSFNFFDIGHSPLAVGSGYLFTSAFVGTPAGLASAGALAVSAPGTGTSYNFAPGFRLAAATQYHFYADGKMRLLGGGTTAIGEAAVFSNTGNQLFTSVGPGNANFRVSGTAAVPEPAAWSLLIGGFALTGSAMRRQRITSQSPG